MVKKELKVRSHAMPKSLGFILFSIDRRELLKKLNWEKGIYEFQQDHSNNSVN